MCVSVGGCVRVYVCVSVSLFECMGEGGLLSMRVRVYGGVWAAKGGVFKGQLVVMKVRGECGNGSKTCRGRLM